MSLGYIIWLCYYIMSALQVNSVLYRFFASYTIYTTQIARIVSIQRNGRQTYILCHFRQKILLSLLNRWGYLKKTQKDKDRKPCKSRFKWNFVYKGYFIIIYHTWDGYSVIHVKTRASGIITFSLLQPWTFNLTFLFCIFQVPAWNGTQNGLRKIDAN